jgi:anti-sigma-K factor RskA
MDERLEELFPMYALGALSEDERARVDAYVAADPNARTRLEEALHSAGVIGFEAQPVAPSPQVKHTLMARVNADAQSRFAPVSKRARWNWPRFAWPALAVASLLAVIILGAWVASLNAQLARLQQETARLQQELLTQQEVLAQLSAPEVSASAIAGTAAQPQAHGQMLADPSQQQAVLVVSDLAPLPPDRTYQFWLIRQNVPVSAGLFTVDAQGHAILAVQSAEAIGSFDAIGVSIEPAGGSQQPTGDIVMLGSLSPSS